VEVALYAVAIIVGGYHWGREGIEEVLEQREIGIKVLMLAATIGSALLGMWDEAALLVVLYGLAEGLEEYTYARTRASIRSLLDLAPKEARVLRNGSERLIPAQDLKVGEVFLVKPGESLPTDGVVLNGCSSVNEAPVTGESLPVEKREGAKVFAATINQEGALEIRATATFADNTLSKIIHLVEEAQEQKGKTQLFIEQFGRIYSPGVLVSAVLLLVIPALLGIPLAAWAKRAVVLLVAAAPCALVMSTPVAIAAGIGRAGKHGILIKGGSHLESLGRIRVVAFDKTGTLTKGVPAVTDIVALNGSKSDVLRTAYSVERFSEHPLAKAVVEAGMTTGVAPAEARDFSAIAGYGAKATIGTGTVYVGKEGLFKRIGQAPEVIAQLGRFREEGKTVMLVGTEKMLLGAIAVRDQIRPQAAQIVQALHRMGVKVAMLTGDNETTARTVAKELGIDDVKADLRPEDKVEAVRVLKRAYGAVAMVGDGINDAPALAAATVGIAMGVAGSDAAIEAADTALMADDVTKVAYAIRLGRTARRISRQNIVFSILLLAGLIPAALLGLMSVAMAVLLHETSELLAVANGLRVTRG
jgi:Cd2+/Zn2+-exporting ATPase